MHIICFSCAIIPDNRLPFQQSLEFVLEGKKCLLVYRSPNITHEQDQSLQNQLRERGPWNLILGDFNLPCIDWSSSTARTRTGEEYVELFQEIYLQQVVDKPTHQGGNMLDLVLTVDQSSVHSVDVLSEEDVTTSPYSHKYRPE